MLHRPRRVGLRAREQRPTQERPSGWPLRPTPRGSERASTALRLHTVRLLAPADSPWWCHPPAVQAHLALYNATTLASIATRRIPPIERYLKLSWLTPENAVTRKFNFREFPSLLKKTMSADRKSVV